MLQELWHSIIYLYMAYVVKLIFAMEEVPLLCYGSSCDASIDDCFLCSIFAREDNLLPLIATKHNISEQLNETSNAESMISNTPCKRLRDREKNRKASSQYRKRRKEWIASLEHQVAQLENRNRHLKAEALELQETVIDLMSQIWISTFIM